MGRTKKPEPTAMDIPYGLYELAEDVSNPKPDRRSSDWDKQEVWQKGTRFLVRENKRYINDGVFRNSPQIRKVTGRYYRSNIDPWDTEQWNALVGGFKPCADEDVDTVWAESDRHYDNHLHIMQRLVDMGKITLNDLREAIAFEDPVEEEAKAEPHATMEVA